MVVGFTLNSIVASHFVSHAKVNQPLSITSTFAEQQLRYAQTLKQEIPEPEELEPFQRLIQRTTDEDLYQRPMGDIMQGIAKQFLGIPYKANLLDQSQQETLVVSLKQFDCMLFIETVLAIARGVAVQDYSYRTFVDRIREQRYRNGEINGYCSRLHYFSEWLLDNEKRGTVKNIGQDLKGIPLNKRLNFMSRHRDKYPQLIDDITYNCRIETEAKLGEIKLNYIPTNQIHRAYGQLHPGDLVAVATDIPGLDVTHTGLVYHHSDGSIGFIHASPIGDVTIARDLQRYVSRVESALGILVARPIDPRKKL